jgi:hypothetical protein
MTNITSNQILIISHDLYYISFAGLISLLCFIRSKNIFYNLINHILLNNNTDNNTDNNTTNNTDTNNNQYIISDDEENIFDNKNNELEYTDSPPSYNDLFNYNFRVTKNKN